MSDLERLEEIKEQVVKALCERNGWDYAPNNEETGLAREDVEFILTEFFSLLEKVARDEGK